MGKITGLEDIGKVPPKVEKLYGAVRQLIQEGADVTNIKVSSLTELAGIGKGTAYEYFDTKEEIVACAVVYHVAVMMDWLRLRFHEKGSFAESLDFMLDENNQIFCLETNTLPGMTSASLIPQEARAVGMSFEDLCEKLIQISLKHV